MAWREKIVLVTYNELVQIAKSGVITADENGKLIDESNINAASIDITLGYDIMAEVQSGGCVDLQKKQSPTMRKIHIDPEHGYTLLPGEFILATTAEFFNLPLNIGLEYKLKSSLARSGLNHSLAGWADPGWHGSQLTLELQNITMDHRLILRTGMKIGQVVLWKGEDVPHEKSYASRGQYNHQVGATESKGLR